MKKIVIFFAILFYSENIFSQKIIHSNLPFSKCKSFILPCVSRFCEVLLDTVKEGLNVNLYNEENEHNEEMDADTTGNYFLIQQKIKYSLHNFSQNSSYKTDPDSPVFDKKFSGNPISNFTPTDNSIAVNENGTVVSTVNSSLYIFDSSGKSLSGKTFLSLVKDTTLQGHHFFDAKVIYDFAFKRFIVVSLYGDKSTNNFLLVLFSKTNNPTQGWNIYKLNATFNQSGLWSDYPNIAVSNDELFITTNMFDDNDNFSQVIIAEIGKRDGYNGSSLKQKLWTNLESQPFCVVPAPYGHEGTYGPGMYFVSNSASGGSRIQVFYISDTIDASQQKITHITLDTDPYKPALYAAQNGSTDLLDNGKNRIRNAFFLNGIIHFVFAKSDANNFGTIAYYRVDAEKNIIEYNTFFMDGIDCAYPAVASISGTEENRDVIIGFLASSKNIFPAYLAVMCDHYMNFSATTIIRKGDSYINALTATLERWGDYSGIARQPLTNKIWLAGSYANSGNVWANYIARTYNKTDSLPYKNLSENISLFPNPVLENLYISFELSESHSISVDIVSADGKFMEEVWKNVLLKDGKYKLEFNSKSLANGIYFLLIRDGNTLIKKEKFIIF